MKKLSLTTVLFVFLMFITNGIQAQNLPKGSVLGFHDAPVTLAAGVTMQQYEDFVKTKVLPAYEKNFMGTKVYLLKGKRGQCIDCYAFVMIFPSDELRNKFFKGEGEYTEAGQKAVDGMKAVVDEWNKLGTYTDRYTDWVVQ